jgi:hypothetical protein
MDCGVAIKVMAQIKKPSALKTDTGFASLAEFITRPQAGANRRIHSIARVCNVRQLSPLWLELGLSFCLVREQADGAFSYAAVPRVGLWPTTPP